MNGKINHKIIEALRQDDFEVLTDYVWKMCKLLTEDFLREHKRLPNNENQIRSILLEECMHGKFTAISKAKDSEVYKCIYHIESGQLELRHIFPDFSDIVN